jgi:hypothetical protein
MEPMKKKSAFRLRNWFIWVMPLILIGLLYYTDPDKGAASTLVWALRLCVGVFVVAALAHLTRRFLHDYPEADMQTLLRKAGRTSAGAGMASIALAIVIAALLLVVSTAARAQDVKTFIPQRCLDNLIVMKGERMVHWADHPRPQYLAALAEHESCLSLTHSRCCNVTSRLKTSREEGAGIPQITRAYRTDGSLRFDSLAEMRDRHPALRDLSWENVYKRADLQNRTLILMSRDNFRFFTKLGVATGPALHFADAGYNGGNGGVQNERRACGLVAGCDPGRWFGHVELRCMKSKAALYGNRSACDINRHHVHDVVVTRSTKYRNML